MALKHLWQAIYQKITDQKSQKKDSTEIRLTPSNTSIDVELGRALWPLLSGDLMSGDLTQDKKSVPLSILGELPGLIQRDVGMPLKPLRFLPTSAVGPNEYRLFIRGQNVGNGYIYPGFYQVLSQLTFPDGAETIREQVRFDIDPLTHAPCYWVPECCIAPAEAKYYPQAAHVLRNHCYEVALASAGSLVSMNDLMPLLKQLRQHFPQEIAVLIDERDLSLKTLHYVLCHLWEARVSTRDWATVLANLIFLTEQSNNPDEWVDTWLSVMPEEDFNIFAF
ncbi:MAG: FHIPEP family type III secretion protein [Cyanobacteria bacterium]|nr:FHIPEP family type III secretion protein [Cyanobacteriota bacterium]